MTGVYGCTNIGLTNPSSVLVNTCASPVGRGNNRASPVRYSSDVYLGNTSTLTVEAS